MKSTAERPYQYRQGVDIHARKARVLRLVGHGLPTSVVAQRLGLSRDAVGAIVREARQAERSDA